MHAWDDNDNIALVAVGGYGRGELHPHSDIDLLILLDDTVSNEFDEQLQMFVTFLWDIGLEIGSSVRSVSQTISLAKEDITVITDLQESRTLCGHPKLLDKVISLTAPSEMWALNDFFRAKIEEQTERHNKHDNTEYNLEPNVKNSPGGLRDIQTINWVAKRYFEVRTLSQLEGRGFFSEKEYASLRKHEAFLWQVRYAIHMITGRADERLQFETQRQVATILGFNDSNQQLAVESFMHRYYRSAMAIRELNDVLLQYIEEAIFQSNAPVINVLNDRFQLNNNHIEVTRQSVFDETPNALLEIFVLMGNESKIDGVSA